MDPKPSIKRQKQTEASAQICEAEVPKACHPWPTKCRVLMGLLVILLLASVGGTGWSLFQHRLITQRLTALESCTHSLSQQEAQGKAHLSQLAQSHQDMAQSAETMEQALTTLHGQESKLQDMERALHQLIDHLETLHENPQAHDPEHEHVTPSPTRGDEEFSKTVKHQATPLHKNELKRLANQLASNEAFDIDEETAHLLPRELLDHVTQGAAHPVLPFPQLIKMFKASLPKALTHQEISSDNLWSKLASKIMVIRKTGDRAAPGSLDNTLAQVENHLSNQDAPGALEALHGLPQAMHPAFAPLVQGLETIIIRHEALDALEHLEQTPQEAS